MSIDLEKAIELAKEHFSEGYRQSIEVRPSKSPDPLPYGFDPEGWAWFVIIEKVPLRVGGDKYVAVNMETGKTKYFGAIGD